MHEFPDLEPAPPEVKRYERQKLFTSLVSMFLNLAWLGILGFFLGNFVWRELAPWTGESAALRLLAVALFVAITSEALTLGLDFYSTYTLEHRYQLSNQTLRGWITKRFKAYAVGMVLGLPLLFGFYSLLEYAGAFWWLWATLAWLAVTLVLGKILPVLILPLFYKVEPLQDESLLVRFRRLAKGTGLNVEGIYKLHLSEETKKANAALAGLGKSRRVLLGDTLLEHFSPEEIEVVFAHEVGHHVHGHLTKSIVLSTVFSLVGFFLIDRVLAIAVDAGTLASRADPAGLPILFFALGVFGALLNPLEHLVSRVFEVEADNYAIKQTNNASAFRHAFLKLAELNKADPDPPSWIVWLFHDHPPIRQRLALARETPSSQTASAGEN